MLQVGTVSAEDTMDDGSPIKLAVTIDRSDGSAVFDFEGMDIRRCIDNYRMKMFMVAVQRRAAQTAATRPRQQ
jgi:N-methylhydantoinase B/oxoprolinase/acetone carboxylase alpha subunit